MMMWWCSRALRETGSSPKSTHTIKSSRRLDRTTDNGSTISSVSKSDFFKVTTLSEEKLFEFFEKTFPPKQFCH